MSSPIVVDGGPWRGPSEDEWLRRIEDGVVGLRTRARARRVARREPEPCLLVSCPIHGPVR